jgi:hypothetical protein
MRFGKRLLRVLSLFRRWRKSLVKTFNTPVKWQGPLGDLNITLTAEEIEAEQRELRRDFPRDDS